MGASITLDPGRYTTEHLIVNPTPLKSGNLAIGSCMAKLLDIHCGSCGLREASKLEESSVARNTLTSTGHKVIFLNVVAATIEKVLKEVRFHLVFFGKELARQCWLLFLFYPRRK